MTASGLPARLSPLRTEKLEAIQSSSFRQGFQLLEGGNLPFALESNSRIEVLVGPSYEPRAWFFTLSTAAGSIVIDDASQGLASFLVDQDVVERWPVGKWVYILRIIDQSADASDKAHLEYCRGDFVVHAGAVRTYEPVEMGQTLNLAARRTEDLRLNLQARLKTVPFDLAGWTVSMKIATSYDPSTVVEEQSGSLGSDTGVFSVVVPQATVAALPKQSLVYWINATKAGDTRDIVRGRVGEKQDFFSGEPAPEPVEPTPSLLFAEVDVETVLPRRVPLKGTEGAGVYQRFRVNQGRVPLDLTAATLALSIWPDFSKTETVIDTFATSDFTFISRPDGEFALSIAAATVGAWPLDDLRSFAYRLKMTLGGRDYELCRGSISILAG